MKKYAVIFKTFRDLPIPEDYLQVNKRMVELVSTYGGYLGVDSVMNDEGKGISISYWDSLDDIKNWKKNSEHLLAQKRGISEWYKYYKVEICEILNEYEKESLVKSAQL